LVEVITVVVVIVAVEVDVDVVELVVVVVELVAVLVVVVLVVEVVPPAQSGVAGTPTKQPTASHGMCHGIFGSKKLMSVSSPGSG
jgi:hypothetical protein